MSQGGGGASLRSMKSGARRTSWVFEAVAGAGSIKDEGSMRFLEEPKPYIAVYQHKDGEMIFSVLGFAIMGEEKEEQEREREREMLPSECGELGEKSEQRRRAASCCELGDEDAHESGGVQIRGANGLIRCGLACGDREETCG